MAFHKANIVSVVWPTPNMDNNCKQGIFRLCILNRVAQLELKWEYNPVRELLVTAKLLNVLEPLQMDDQDVRWLLYLHPLLCFLQTVYDIKLYLSAIKIYIYI